MTFKSANSHHEILDNLYKQHLEGRFCDLNFTLDETMFKAHSCIVDIASPFLSRYLKRETGLWSLQSPLVVDMRLFMKDQDACPACFSKLLLFIYKREIQVDSAHIAHLYNLAFILEVKELMALLKEEQCANKGADVTPSCETCSQQFDSLESFEQHKHVLHNSMYVCLQCDFTSHKLHPLLNHLDDCPPGDTCPICLFKDPSNIHQHIQDHKNPKPFLCLHCQQRFKNRTAWRTHSCLPKSLKCNLCEKTFTKTTSYEQHLSRHKTKMKYSCKMCTYSAPYESYLRRHMAKHVDRLTCSYPGCSFETPWKHNLKEHLNAHKNSKLFSCILCNAVFSYDKNLRRHLKVVHDKTEFNCKLCTFKCARLDKLKAHCQSEHSNEREAVENMLKEYREIDKAQGNKFIPKYKRTDPKWKKQAEERPENGRPTVCLSETTGEFTLLKEGSIPVASVTSTSLLTIGNFREGTGSVTLNEVTGVLTLNNLNSESTGAVFLNESTGELSYINLNQDGRAMEVEEEQPPAPGDMEWLDINEDSDDDFDNLMFDGIPWTDDFDFPSLPSEGVPHLNETTGELSFDSYEGGVWEGMGQLAGNSVQDVEQSDFAIVLNEETGELISHR